MAARQVAEEPAGAVLQPRTCGPRAGVPAFMFRVGSLAPQRIEEFALKGLKPPGAHSAYYFPEPQGTLRTALIAMAAAVLELLAKKQQ